MVKMGFTHALFATVLTPAVSGAQAPATRFELETFQSGVRSSVDEYVLAPPNQAGQRNGVLRSSVFVPSRGERISTEFEFDTDWRAVRVQFSLEAPDGQRTWTEFGERRITFRSITSTGEEARELPRRGNVVVYDPNIPSLLSTIVQLPAGPVTVFSIRTSSTAAGNLVDHGLESKTFDDGERQSRHIELVTPRGSFHCWFSPDGRLELIEAAHLEVRTVGKTE